MQDEFLAILMSPYCDSVNVAKMTLVRLQVALHPKTTSLCVLALRQSSVTTLNDEEF